MRIFTLIIIMVFALLAKNIEEKNLYDLVKYFTLKNGMQIYMLSDSKAENTQIEVIVGVGYDNENRKNYGLSHLVEHLVFRDSRIPQKDYLDYLKEHGATDVNGYTGRYETGFYATIEANKSYWLVKTFSKMLFDKNLTQEDLRIEKQAVQTEIGKAKNYSKPLYSVLKFTVKTFNLKRTFYEDNYNFPKDDKRLPRYIAQQNNPKFTLKEALKRYRRYYYPKNMKLLIAGNFNEDKMRRVLKESFGVIDINGTDKIVKPHFKLKLNGKPYIRYKIGEDKNYAYIGTKYIIDSYKKYLIADIYTNSLANRLQQKLRNREGKTYSVNQFDMSKRNAGLQGVKFDGLHSVFTQNIAEAEEMIKQDRIKLSEETIQKAMKNYESDYYKSIEHDSDTLMDIVDTALYLKDEYNITGRSDYDIFRSITPAEFQKTVSEMFAPQNRYKYVYKDYWLFPSEVLVFDLFNIALIALTVFVLMTINLKRKGLYFTRKDILYKTRISSLFTGFLIMFATFIIAVILNYIFSYFIQKYIFGDSYYFKSLDVPYRYIAGFFDGTFFVLIFFAVLILLWNYYARVYVVKDKLIFHGTRIDFIDKDKIEKIDIIPYSRRKNCAKIYGFSWLYKKELISIKCTDGNRYCLRNSNLNFLKEYLENWMNKVENI